MDKRLRDMWRENSNSGAIQTRYENGTQETDLDVAGTLEAAGQAEGPCQKYAPVRTYARASMTKICAFQILCQGIYDKKKNCSCEDLC